jgi:threonine dehydrogenase-like Zn-dependent dehydrogenase
LACHVLPDDLSWEIGVLLTGDGFGVPFHTSTKFRSDDVRNVAIFGAGPIGLGSVIMQTYLKRRVIIVDFSAERLAIAKQLGADVCINAGADDPIAGIRAATDGLGADVCIEATGKPEPAKSCFAAAKTGGQVIFNGEQGKVELSISEDFIRRDMTATGSWFYHFGEYERMLALYRQGLPVASLVSDVMPFRTASDAFRKFADGRSAKVLLRYE